MRLLIAWLLAILALAGTPAHAEFPARPTGPILDQAELLPAAEEDALDLKLRDYTARTGRALMVVTVRSLDDQDVASYTVQLGHAWGVGGKTTDQGLIFLIAPTERKMRIETGYGLEEYLPDALASRIIRQEVTPRFKANDYPGGIARGVDAIITQLDKDPAEARAIAEAAAAAQSQRGSDTGFGGAIFWIILIVFLAMMFGRRRRGIRRSGIDPGIVLWGVSEVLHHATRGGGGGIDFGGGGGGGGSDWGGFGGGDFGGGGASGDW